MNTKIALSGLSIFAALALVGGATFAYFSDSATSTGNLFGAGTLSLNLDDPGESPAPSISASFGTGVTPIVPGGTTSGYISLENAGSIDMDHLTLTVTQTANSTLSLADKLNVTSAKLGTESTCVTSPVDLLPGWQAQGGLAAPTSLTQLITKTEFNAIPGGLLAGATRYLCLTFTMDSGSDDSYQGTTTTDTFTFIGKQNSSQTP